MAIIRELFLVYTFTCNSYGAMPWSVLPNNTGDLCPSRDVCMWKKRRDVEHNDMLGLTSCCQDCSCDKSCGTDHTCCFPRLDITNGASLKYKSCLQANEPELDFHLERNYHRYFMVDSNPDGGCIVDVPTMPTGVQCGNVSVAWWGTLFPSYSDSKKTIYKNSVCAQCHNATDARLFAASLKWCPLDTVYEALTSNDKQLKSIFKQNQCLVSFTYKDDNVIIDTRISNEQCYINTIDNCPSDFSVPVDIGQNKYEMEKACVSGLFSPFITYDAIYSNVFCAICNDIHNFGTTMCPVLSHSERSVNGHLSVLLDIEVIDAIQTMSSIKQGDNIEAACHSLNDQVECRRVLCPTGMISFNGECRYMSTTTFGYPYIIMISLIPDNNVDIQITDLHQEITQQNKPVNILSVWSKKWSIGLLFAKDNYFYSNASTRVEELVIMLQHRPKRISPKLLMHEIKRNLENNHISLSVGNETYKFRQSMAKFDRLAFHANLYKNRNRYTIVEANNIKNQTIFENVLKNLVYILIPSNKLFTFMGEKVHVTQTHVCSQIQLTHAEYILITPYVVYYKHKDTYLLGGQFSIYTDDSEEKFVRICLSDTDFRLTSAASTLLKIKEVLFILCLILVQALV